MPAKRKPLYGVAINDAPYPVTEYYTLNGVTKRRLACNFHRVWSDMIRRCYSERFKEKYPTYKECTCCPEWIYFSKFKAWMETQDWEGKELDKDLLFEGNKIYSPETCIFIPQRVNKFMHSGIRVSEKTPDSNSPYIGVTWSRQDKIYKAQSVTVIGKIHVSLGCFKDPLEAHNAWRAFKYEQAKILIEIENLDETIANALLKRYLPLEI